MLSCVGASERFGELVDHELTVYNLFYQRERAVVIVIRSLVADSGVALDDGILPLGQFDLLSGNCNHSINVLAAFLFISSRQPLIAQSMKSNLIGHALKVR